MPRGIRLQEKKEASLLNWTIRRPHNPPENVIISLAQPGAPAAKPCVKPGDKVLVGEKIALPVHADTAAIHASISGTVKAIDIFPHPLLGETSAIEIHTDKRDEKIPLIGHERSSWENLSPVKLAEILQDSGVVDLETGAAVHQEVRGPENITDLYLNACEPEPYITADYSLLMAHPVEVLKGALILKQVSGAARVVFFLRQPQLEAVELLKSKIYFLKWKNFEVEVLPALYPYGSTELMRAQWKPQKAEAGRLAVFNIATAFAAYEAVVMQKPFYERAVTVGGECVVEPRNVWARIGSEFNELIKQCRGILRPPGKVVMNGPMKGAAQESLQVPVIKETRAILALPKEITKPEEVQPCIRCGRCLESCPVDISPAMITLAAEQDLFAVAGEYGSGACIECGNCSYVCPSKRPMVELIRYSRQ